MRDQELRGATFACLEGCGFCCTFQAEVSVRELALLRKAFQPRAVSVAVGNDGRSFLQLRNKCGACTLLERRACSAYDLRPAHCRYFPFHLHFAEEPEIYVNYTCRGVVHDDSGDLAAQFRAQVLDVARPEDIREHERLARETYAQFKRNARRAGVWGDAQAAVEEALAQGVTLFTGTALARLAETSFLAEDTPEAILAEALAPFGARDVTARPFYLREDLAWITFDRPAPDRLAVLEMDETGALDPRAELRGYADWMDPPAEQAKALLPYLRRLVSRRLFVGSAYGLVDDTGYEMRVEDAARARLVEVVADLVLRARILRDLGVPEARLADEVARFYDTTFLDAPTIGGFL